MAATIERTGAPLGGSTRHTRLLRGKTFKEATFYASDLPKKAKEKVCERERYTYDSEPEWLTEQLLEDVRYKGYGDLEAQWSAGFCQSDFVEFSSKGSIDVDKPVVFRRVLGAKKLKKIIKFFERRDMDFMERTRVYNVSASTGGGSVEMDWESYHVIVGADFQIMHDSGRMAEKGSFKTYKIGCTRDGKLAQELDEHKVTSVWRNGADYLVSPITDEEYVEKLMTELGDGIAEDLRSLARDAYSWLRDEILWRHEDEQVLESLDANERKFYRNGDEA